MVEMSAALGEQQVQRFGLGLVRGKPSKIAPLSAHASSRSPISAVTMASLTSSPRVHDRLGLDADRGAAGDGLAQHVAGRQLDHAARRLQPRRLRPLARARRAQQDDIQHCGALSLFAG